MSVTPDNYSNPPSDSHSNIMRLTDARIRRASIRSSKSMDIKGSKVSSEAGIKEDPKPRPVRLEKIDLLNIQDAGKSRVDQVDEEGPEKIDYLLEDSVIVQSVRSRPRKDIDPGLKMEMLKTALEAKKKESE